MSSTGGECCARSRLERDAAALCSTESVDGLNVKDTACPGTHCDPAFRGVLDCACATGAPNPAPSRSSAPFRKMPLSKVAHLPSLLTDEERAEAGTAVELPVVPLEFGGGHGDGHGHGHGDIRMSDPGPPIIQAVHPPLCVHQSFPCACCCGVEYHVHSSAHAGHADAHGHGHGAGAGLVAGTVIDDDMGLRAAGDTARLLLHILTMLRAPGEAAAVPAWQCGWEKCKQKHIVQLGGQTAEQHLLEHYESTIRHATACKVAQCEGHKVQADPAHIDQCVQQFATTVGDGPIRCTWSGQCTRRFRSIEDLAKHLKTHAQLDATHLRCSWEGCNAAFEDPSSLRAHMLSLHLKEVEGMLQNRLCLKAESAPQKKAEKVEKAPTTPECQWMGCQHVVPGGNVPAMMFEHIMQSHANWITTTPERVILCKWAGCGRFFADKTKFAEHIRAHVGYKNVKCTEPGCDHTFTNQSMMRSHVKRHHTKSFKCEICAAQGIERHYTTAFNLREHKKIAHEETYYTCPKCAGQYKSHKAFRAHVRRCTEGLPEAEFPPALPPGDGIEQSIIFPKRAKTASNVSGGVPLTGLTGSASL